MPNYEKNLFGDSHWIKLKCTAIVIPHAPTYTTFFCGVFEFFLIERFGNSLLLYIWFIDGVLALWKRYDK